MNETTEKPQEKTEAAQAAEKLKQMLPTSGITGFVPKTLPDLMEMSKLLASSELVPRGLKGKAADVMIVIMHGLEVGVSPAQALAGIMVINGHPSMWGDLAIGVVRASKLCELIKEDPPHVALKQGFGRCYAKRVGGEEREYQFSIDDAKKANLWTKAGPWTQYPGRMLMMRARSWVLRDLFPDVLKGLAIAEEQRDAIPTTAEVIPDPEPVKVAAPAAAAETKAPEKKDEVVDADIPTAAVQIGKVVKATRNDKPIFRAYADDDFKYETEVETVANLLKLVRKDDLNVLISWAPIEEGFREILLAKIID